jgi:hypothetical protein
MVNPPSPIRIEPFCPILRLSCEGTGHSIKAVPSAHSVLGLARPGAKGAMLAFPRERTHLNRCRVLQDDGIGTLGVAIAMEHQSQEGSQLYAIPIRGFHKFAVRSQRRELLTMIPLDMPVHFGLVR